MRNLKAIFEKYGYGHLEQKINNLEEGYEERIKIDDDAAYGLMYALNATGEYLAYDSFTDDYITIEPS
ncbi:hypothetical protein [Listeria welshimeri]|uniref:hypothetical protein n=1 Tax=Listeria welshimeri TaxID=1643 RepID=UPI001626856B|nr:hypothetical protein [Listeria welshimeri]MBC1705811.1 hypothetical protein [Listeria welshimeri]MBF2342575.1 hypothetical protein [Listeria welshimeri]